MQTLKVLYEDNHLIAVVKPAGLLTQGAHPNDGSLLEDVRMYIKEKYNKPGNVFVGLLHRLDRNVSGIVLFAKTSKGASRLSEQIRNHAVEKTYHAIVCAPLEKDGRLTHYLLKDEEKNKTTVFDAPRPGTKEATLSYHVVKKGTKRSLVKITLETGRSHQIRAQFAEIGAPLLGDVKYGGEPMSQNELCLCATSLSFTTATGDEPVEIEIEYPKEWKDYIE